MDIKENINVETNINIITIGDNDKIGRLGVYFMKCLAFEDVVFLKVQWGIIETILIFSFSSYHAVNQIKILGG